MQFNNILECDTVTLRPIALSDATPQYVSWLNNSDIVRYTESRFSKYTVESVLDYIRKVIDDPSEYMFAIVDRETQRHIGNIKLGGINAHHRFGDVGIIIGESSFSGRGIATEAVRAVTRFAFDVLGLHMIFAGIYACNKPSIRVFEKATYLLAYVQRKKYYLDGEYIDCPVYAIYNEGA